MTAPAAPRAPVPFSKNARTVLARRYLLRDEAGALRETPEQLLERVATAIAEVEAPGERDRWAESFHTELASLCFLPNSPTLMNAGTGRGTLAACFVLPVEDTLESIMSTAAAAAVVQKFGGGTGFALSRLRPEGEPIASTHGAACGPLSVLRHYDDVSRLVTQGGKREGANMGVLRVDHPDVRAFVHAKDDGETARRFNISVGATDEFMAAARDRLPLTLRDPRGGDAGSADASALLDEIAASAWRTGDPGLLFLDPIERANPTPALGTIEATNPCGEVPLLPWEACTLGSLNVARFWDAERGDLDGEALAASVAVAVRFLDDVIEADRFPLPEIENAVRGSRKIGLGVMGFADLLIAAGLPYDSEEALALADRLTATLRAEADRASAQLAVERGAFPNSERSVYAGGERYRNATRTSIAPTGTIAILAGASSGIEPLFSLAHERRMGDGTLLHEASAAFEAAARAGGYDSPELYAALAAGDPLSSRPEVPAAAKRLFATALEIAPEWHVRMQATFQRHIDLAVSKTVNMPREATPEQVRAVYELAWDLGCKGVTIYRDGSRAQQVLAHIARPEGAAAAVACPICEE
jgi:ribonucleoside-diphosphate reductase alpha chain